MLKLYNMAVSGNCYKVRLLLAHLNRPYEKIEVRLGDRSARPPELLRLNPAGRVPLLLLEDGKAIPESNAILWYLARDTEYLPKDPLLNVRTLQWMFFEQNLHEPNIAVVRYWVALLKQPENFAEPIRIRTAAGNAALQTMDEHLTRHDFFSAEHYTIADIALYAYTHVAGDGGFDLAAYPAVGRWLERVKQQPGHVPMQS